MIWIVTFAVAADSSAQLVDVPSVKKDKFLQEGKRFRLGNFSVLPYMLFKNTVDDNALYSDKDERIDDMIDLQPGFDLMGHGSKMDFMLGYKFDYHKNVNYGVQDYFAHDLGTEFYTNPFGKRVFIRIADYFADTTEPADIEILTNMKVLDNEAAAEIGYRTPGEDLEMSLGYINNYKHYNEIWNGSSFFGNGFELKSRINLSSRYRFLPKTQATFDFNYTRAKQTFGQDFTGGAVLSNGYRMMTGITGAFTRKLSLNVRVGYTNIGFNIDQNASAFLTEVGLNYSFTNRLNMKTGYSRQINYSVFSPYNTTDSFDFLVGYAFHSKLKTSLKFQLDDIKFSGPVTNGLEQRRKDFDTKLILDIAYRLKEWLSIISGYQLQNRSSNMVGYLEGNGSADFMRNTYYIGFGFNHF